MQGSRGMGLKCLPIPIVFGILYAHTGLLIFVRKVRKHHTVINGKLQRFLITELQGL